jgi:hypothetical protein
LKGIWIVLGSLLIGIGLLFAILFGMTFFIVAFVSIVWPIQLFQYIFDCSRLGRQAFSNNVPTL